MNFKDMPLHSRVWIYQSIREFSENEITQLKAKAESFIYSFLTFKVGKLESSKLECFARNT